MKASARAKASEASGSEHASEGERSERASEGELSEQSSEASERARLGRPLPRRKRRARSDVRRGLPVPPPAAFEAPPPPGKLTRSIEHLANRLGFVAPGGPSAFGTVLYTSITNVSFPSPPFSSTAFSEPVSAGEARFQDSARWPRELASVGTWYT